MDENTPFASYNLFSGFKTYPLCSFIFFCDITVSAKFLQSALSQLTVFANAFHLGEAI